MNKLGIVERDGKTVGYLVRSPATGAVLLFYTKAGMTVDMVDVDGEEVDP